MIGAVSPSFVRSHGEGGVLIEELQPQSPARKSGLLEADVVLSIDGVPVSSPEDYHSLLQTYTPGDSLNLTLLRGLQQLQKTVILTSLPEGYELAYTRRVFGFELRQEKRGLLIAKVIADSAAKRVGIRRGDRIIKVDGVKVETLSEYERVIEYRLGRQPLTFTVVRDNTGYLIELP